MWDQSVIEFKYYCISYTIDRWVNFPSSPPKLSTEYKTVVVHGKSHGNAVTNFYDSVAKHIDYKENIVGICVKKVEREKTPSTLEDRYRLR